MEAPFKVGDKVKLTGTDITAVVIEIRSGEKGHPDKIICNHWSDDKNPNDTDWFPADNLSLLTPLEQLL
jgi:hypothetical protein